jgi:hypothetical protein
MHFNFDFTAVQILWTLTLAAHLVLLVVLLGRDRIRRFRWFFTGIALVTLRLIASRLLFGRMPQIVLGETFLVLGFFSAIVGLLVLIELSRMTFRNATPRAWGMGIAAALTICALALAAMGPWPTLVSIVPNSLMNAVNLLQLLTQKGGVAVDLLSVELGLLSVFFGRRCGTGWRSHSQLIIIGLSTASLGQLATQLIWQAIAKSAAPHSMAEYVHIMDLREKLLNANSVIYLAVLIWWILWLWFDEPGARPSSDENVGSEGSAAA